MSLVLHRYLRLAIVGFFAACAVVAGARPNILWICTDQQRFDTIGALGNPHIHTPNLDRLVASGVSFTRAYVQNPICTPSRSSFLTGFYPASIRAMQNGNGTFSDAAPLIPKVLASAGYLCGLVGKLHLASAFNGPEKRVDDGYTWLRYSHDPKTRLDQGNEYWRWLLAKGVNLDSVFVRNVGAVPGDLLYSGYRPEVPPELHHTAWCTDEAVDFINSQSRDPKQGSWMLSLNYFSPHPPFDPPAAYRKRYDAASLPGPHVEASDFETEAKLAKVDFQTHAQKRDPALDREDIARYYALIEQVDDGIGRLLATLAINQQTENTLIIFSSDHGEMLGDHGLRGKGCRFYEGLIHVPLILSWPGHFAADRRVDELVECVDIAPTIYELVGMVGPRRLPGHSLVPWLQPGTTPAAGSLRSYVRAEYYNTLADFPGFVGSYATMVRDQQFKCVIYHNQDFGELYDLKADPWEHHNLWEVPAQRDARERLVRHAFDSLATTTDLGSERVGRY